jgi:hypothetical protein
MAKPEGVSAETLPGKGKLRLIQNLQAGLVAETSADRHALAANGATAAEHGCASLGLHAGAEAMGFHAFASIRLKCALGHENALLFPDGNLCLDGKYLVYRRLGQESSRKRGVREYCAVPYG